MMNDRKEEHTGRGELKEGKARCAYGRADLLGLDACGVSRSLSATLGREHVTSSHHSSNMDGGSEVQGVHRIVLILITKELYLMACPENLPENSFTMLVSTCLAMLSSLQ